MAGRMTGIARYLLHFLRYGTSAPAGHEYVLFCNQHTEVPLQNARIKKVVINEKFTPLWDQVLLPRSLKEEKADVFLTPYFKAPFFMPCKTVLIINDLIPLFFPEESGPFRKAYFNFWCGRAARRADRIITISEHTKKDVVKCFGIDAEKIRVVYLAAERDPGGTDTVKVRSKYGLPDEFIFYVGNLSPHKNIKSLISAYGLLPQGLRAKYKLVLGTKKGGRYFQVIEKFIKAAGLTEDVVFTGFIKDADLPAVYRASSLFAFPSLYEGFGLPPLEAMAYGVPVVSSDCSSIPEVVRDAGILVNPVRVQEIADAMEKVLCSDNLKKEMIQKGLARASEFSIEKFGSDMLKILEELMPDEKKGSYN